MIMTLKIRVTDGAIGLNEDDLENPDSIEELESSASEELEGIVNEEEGNIENIVAEVGGNIDYVEFVSVEFEDEDEIEVL